MLSLFMPLLKNNLCRDICLMKSSWGAVNEVIRLILSFIGILCLCYILSLFLIHLLMLYSFLVMDLFIYLSFIFMHSV